MASARLIALSAALLGAAAAWMIVFHFNAVWACLFALALGLGLMEGIAWEKPVTRQLAAEIEAFQREAGRQREELVKIQQQNSALSSEPPLPLHTYGALYYRHLPPR